MSKNRIPCSRSRARSCLRVIASFLLIASPSFGKDVVESRVEKAQLEIVRDIPFAEVDGQELLLDLRVPENVQRPPLVVWIHGGGWVLGDKKKCRFCWLAHEGYAVASINYRLASKSTFPAQIHDCKAAIRWLRANQNAYGYDASRVAVAGSSAGGHLAALLATSGGVEELEGTVGGNLDESSRIQAAVSISGFSDLTTSYASIPDQRIVMLLGGTPAERPEQSDLASPIRFVGPGDAPLLLFHGEEDPVVDPQQSAQLHRAYQRAKLESWLVMIPEVEHENLSTRDPKLRAQVERFLDRHMKR